MPIFRTLILRIPRQNTPFSTGMVYSMANSSIGFCGFSLSAAIYYVIDDETDKFLTAKRLGKENVMYHQPLEDLVMTHIKPEFSRERRKSLVTP